MASPRARFSTRSSLQGPGAMELLDGAVSLLRRAPVAVVSIYYLGALPFCLGVIYFWFDMTQSATAEAHLPAEALLLAALYFWMKTCQAVFARKLLALLEGEDAELWTARRWAATALLQAIYAGSFVIVYPAAILITLPFGWVNAFYHTISIIGTSTRSTLGSSFREAADLARLWPKQNHLVIGTVFLAVFVLFLNLAAFCMMIPQLLNSLFGVETVFDQNARAWNNSSFYLDVFVFCFLALNPLNKAVYVLRCFYGRARLNGADLRAELRRHQPASAPLRAAILALVLLLVADPGARAADPATPPPSAAPAAASVPTDPAAANLDRAIQKTLQKDEFAWRLPRVETASEDDSFFAKTLRSALKFLKKLVRAPFKLIGKFFKWLFASGRDHDTGNSAFAAIAALPWRGILLLFAAIVLAILGYFLVRHLRNRQPARALDTLRTAPVRTVDLESENVQADELPEESWLALAQQLIERGELRLALRAFYLATLSALARQQLIRLGPGKSNRDYVQEVTRRLRGEAPLVPFFRESIRLFEASWYGTHDVTPAAIETMRENQRHLGNHVVA
jgi:hypothetical protein